MRPNRTATIIAATYLIVSVVYIMASDAIALELTSSAEQFRTVQSVKGAIYVGVIALGLFGLTRVLLRRIDMQTRELQSGREALLGAERRTLAGTLAASVSHDVNNLVGVIKANVDFATRQEDLQKHVTEALEDASLAVERLVSLNNKLRTMAKHKSGGGKQAVALSAVVKESLELIRTHSKVRQCRITVEAAGHEMIEAYPDLINHALINLVLNAADATQGHGRILVSVRSLNTVVELAVQDDGPGIPVEMRKKVVDPFFTTKDDGTGLGLFSVAYCADQHGGEFEIDDSEWGGAKMLLRLPSTGKPEKVSTSNASRPSLMESDQTSPS